jgi:hypothetical protein
MHAYVNFDSGEGKDTPKKEHRQSKTMNFDPRSVERVKPRGLSNRG